MELNATWILQTVILIGIGAIAYFLKKTGNDIEKKICETNLVVKENEEEIKGFKKEFNDYKEKAAKEFVHKDDFIRAVSGIDNKLDKIHDILLKKGSE